MNNAHHMSIHRVGQDVEINPHGNDWYLGRIDKISFEIRNTKNNRQVSKRPEQVRVAGFPGLTGENAHIPVGSAVEHLVQGRGRGQQEWLPGTLINKRYTVRRYVREGVLNDFMDFVSDNRIRPETPQQRQYFVVEEAPAPREEHEDPLQVHEAFADLNLTKFMKIIRRENNGASDFKNKQSALRPLFEYIGEADLFTKDKKKYSRDFKSRPASEDAPRYIGIVERVDDYISEHPGVEDDTLEVIQFVLSQPREYKNLYLQTFHDECMKAYTSGNPESCTKGMWERIYLANKGTIEGLCLNTVTQSASASASASASTCNPMHLALYDTFTPGSEIDIYDIFNQWYDKYSYDGIPKEVNPLENLSVESRMQHYRDFVHKYLMENYSFMMSEKIWNHEDFQKRLEKTITPNQYIFEKLNSTFGGRKRKTIKKRKPVKKQKNRKTKKY